MAVVELKGLDEVLANLNKQIKSIKGDVQKGLTIAMTLVKGESMKNTPVDTGNLRASHYLVSGDGAKSDESSGFKTEGESGVRVASEHPSHVQEAASNARSRNFPFVEIGCTAFYSVYVHEDLEARHPTGGAKFMERAIAGSEQKILSTIKRFAKR